VQAQSQKYSSRIKDVADRGRNRAQYPAKGINPLADQLQIIARLIAGGLQTRVYVVNLGGFDTHWSQAEATDVTTGIHANLLRYLAEGMNIFQQDLKLLGLEKRVVGMTISEFGRRPASSSLGTDHGTAGPMFIFGSSVKGGVIGANPSLTDLLPDGNLKMQYDFRQIYTSMLSQWFLADANRVGAVMMKSFNQLPIISLQTSVRDTYQTSLQEQLAVRNFPNPCAVETRIEYVLPGSSNVRITLHDTLGREIATLFDGFQTAGEHRINANVSTFSQGVYFYTVRTEYGFATGRMSVER
jgi:hypothetical protein